MSAFSDADLEAVYEALAEALEALPAEAREVYLAKTALLLARETGDVEKALAAIEAANAHLP